MTASTTNTSVPGSEAGSTEPVTGLAQLLAPIRGRMVLACVIAGRAPHRDRGHSCSASRCDDERRAALSHD